MTITLRTTKGSALTYVEADDNWRETLELRRAYTDQVTSGGTADVLTADFTQTVSLANGVMVKVKVASANTIDGPTLNVNATGAKTISGLTGSPVGAGTLPAGAVILFSYDSGNDTWVALNFASSDASTLNGQLPNYYLQANNILCTEGTIDPDCLPDPTTVEQGGIRLATAAEVAAGVVTDAAVTPATVGSASPTSNFLEGTNSITGLTVGKTYLMNIYGWGKNRGNSVVTAGSVAAVSGSVGSGTVLTTTGTKGSVNWPDGSPGLNAGLIVVPTATEVSGVVDYLSSIDFENATYMSAVQLD